MNIVKVLKRKDASSVVVAVVVALIVSNAVSAWSARPAQWLSGSNTIGGGWRAGFWQPLVLLVVELIVFEVLIWVYIALASKQGKK